MTLEFKFRHFKPRKDMYEKKEHIDSEYIPYSVYDDWWQNACLLNEWKYWKMFTKLKNPLNWVL
jgi:hypothetical protein